MTITPFLHYGMYSGKFNLSPTVEVWEVVINGQKLDLVDFSSVTDDYIIEPVRSYYFSKQNQDIYERTISRILTKVRLSYHPSVFDSSTSQAAFDEWYKKRLSTILKKDISSIKVFKSTYIVNGAVLKKQQSKIIYAIN